MDEFDLIARFFKPLTAAESGAFMLLDDAAALSVDPGLDIVVTTDTIVAGVHFLDDDPPSTVGEKLLAVNLSDLAAMGARPRVYTLSTALPRTWTNTARTAWLEGLTAGLASVQQQFAVTLIGGDTVATTGPSTLSATAIGTTHSGRQLRRSGALPGDGVYVTGSIGDAALGLRALRGDMAVSEADAAFFIERYRRPTPRVPAGLALNGLASSAADVSDGLVADLGNICRVSGVGMDIVLDHIPLSDPVRRALDSGQTGLEEIVGGGDDYELAFTVPAEEEHRLPAVAVRWPFSFSRIGTVRALDKDGAADVIRGIDAAGGIFALAAKGYRHF